MHAKQRNPSRIQAQEVAQKGSGCDAKVCLTRPSNPLKTLGPEPRLVCFIQRSIPIQTLLPHPRQPCSGRQVNGSFGLGWLELKGPENMEWTMHAKQRNPSRIQAQEVAQKGPECDAKVCLTRPSNPLKTLGPEPRLVCFIQRSNPIQTLLPHPRQPCSGRQVNGSFCLGWLELQGPENMEWTTHAKQRNPSRIQAQEVAQKRPECDAKVCLTRPSNPLKTLGPEPRLVCFIQRSNPIQTLLPHPRQRDACETAKLTPAGFKPKRWPEKVPDATPRCA